MKARGWPYVVTGILFAAICAWISYNDGLFVARLAGNHDALAYFYPLLPDGLIVLCLLALAEAARAQTARSRWAVAGLLLGIGLTLAMNTYAGVEHSALDAVLDGMVPVVFFIAAEVVLWHVRHGRNVSEKYVSGSSPGAVPSSVLDAARSSMAETVRAGNPWSVNQLQGRFSLTRAQARELHAEFAPDRGRGDPIHNGAGSAPATQRGRDGAPRPRTVPAAPPAMNGSGPHGG